MRISDWSSDVCSSDLADEAAARGFRRIALTGTRWLVDSEVYPEKLAARGIECVRPTVAERVEIDRIIMEELVYGVFKPEAVAGFQRIIGRMRDAGCDAVVLGCTRSEEHTSELQSLMRSSFAAFCLEKNKAEYQQTKRQS